MPFEIRADRYTNRSRRALILGLGLVVALSATRLVGTHLMQKWWGVVDFEPSSRGVAFMLGLVLVLSVVIIGGGLFGLAGASWEGLGWRRQDLAREIVRGLLAAMVLGLVTLVFAFIGTRFLGLKPSQPAATQSTVTAGSVLLSVVFGFLVASWSEENLFRGFLQPLFASRWGLAPAIMLQAALFSLAHIGYYHAWPYFVLAFVHGLAFGWLRGRDGSLVAPFVAHGLLG